MTVQDGTDVFASTKAISSERLNTTVLFHGTVLPTNPTNEIPTNGKFLLTQKDGNNAPGFYINTGTVAAPTWAFQAQPVILTSAERTALTGWAANVPIFDSTLKKWYWNSHGSAPSSITWSVVTGETFLKAHKASSTARATTTTRADDPNLSVIAVAGKFYHFKLIIIYGGSNAGDLSFEFTRPAGTVMDWHGREGINDFTGTETSVTTLNTNAGQTHMAEFEGVLHSVSSDGAFALKWARAVSDATATSVLLGSILILHEIG